MYNTRSAYEYVTLVVERDGEPLLVRSETVFPGERRQFGELDLRAGSYRTVVETASGDRATFEWTVDPRLDGLEVGLESGVDFWRTGRCLSSCQLGEGTGTGAANVTSDGLRGATNITTTTSGAATPEDGEANTDTPSLPLVGFGMGRWYDAAGVVLRNPGEERPVDLAVRLDGDPVLSARYTVPERTKLELPITYRGGTYEVEVTVDGRTASAPWPVPNVPSRYVTLDERVTFGCGPANTVLALVNADGTDHRLRVAVRRDGRVLYDETVTLPTDSSRTVEPVPDSGPYEVTMRVDDGPARTETWWSCPPRGPASVVIDATGDVLFDTPAPAG